MCGSRRRHGMHGEADGVRPLWWGSAQLQTLCRGRVGVAPAPLRDWWHDTGEPGVVPPMPDHLRGVPGDNDQRLRRQQGERGAQGEAVESFVRTVGR